MFNPKLYIPSNIKGNKQNNALITDSFQNKAISLLDWLGIDLVNGNNTKFLSKKGTWETISSSPSAPDTSIQYNNAGAFYGDALFERNPSTLRTIIGTPNNRITLGDVTSVGNRTMWRVDDANMLLKGVIGDKLAIVDTSDNTFLEVNTGTKSCSIGDRDNSNNGTVIIVDDINKKISLIGAVGYLINAIYPAYANDAAAGLGGLTTGDHYQTDGSDVTFAGGAVGLVVVKQ